MLNKDVVQTAKYAEELCEELVRLFEHCEGVKYNNRYIVISVENGNIASCSAYKGEIKLESMGEPDMKNENDWYEKGELPPVGAVVEAMPNWNRVEIVARHEGKCVFFDRDINEYDFFCSPNKFRPIRTERDELIEQACAVVSEKASSWNINIDCSAAQRAVIESLVDAGWRPTDVEGE